jgi:phage shock protein PspC (stress-responsive transcriptional regulator)
MPEGRPGLQRSREHRILGGVCGGIAEWLGWNPTLVRVLFVLVSLLSAAFPGIIVYLVMWFLMPEREEAERRPPPGVGIP